MTDMCRVFVVGNFAAGLTRRREDGTWCGTTTLRVGRTDLVAGQPVTTTVSIPVVVLGASRVASVAQQFGAGSRVLIEGHLEQRESEHPHHSSRTSNGNDASMPTPHLELVLVIDTILNAAHAVAEPEARQQPRQIAWQEESESTR